MFRDFLLNDSSALFWILYRSMDAIIIQISCDFQLRFELQCASKSVINFTKLKNLRKGDENPLKNIKEGQNIRYIIRTNSKGRFHIFQGLCTIYRCAYANFAVPKFKFEYMSNELPAIRFNIPWFSGRAPSPKLAWYALHGSWSNKSELDITNF